MTDEIIKELVKRIHLELEGIPRVPTRVEDGWARARSSSDNLYLDAVV